MNVGEPQINFLQYGESSCFLCCARSLDLKKLTVDCTVIMVAFIMHVIRSKTVVNVIAFQVLMDKMRKNQLTMEQTQTDLNTEKSAVVKLEGQRSMLERQNKELKAKLAELEVEIRSKTKATIAALESKVGKKQKVLITFPVGLDTYTMYPL